ncbi:hypothetical protein D5086_028387 [Populus alba]|uniref:Uncharacterized protein n=1 Tax=Populus alba TaxID=43335 RepID=A0ACC4AY75_POPAL
MGLGGGINLQAPNLAFSLLQRAIGWRLCAIAKVIDCGVKSLGLISGMTGGGGNVGAVLTQLIFFRGSKYSKETGIMLMGVMIICCTLPICLIHFPQWGGMFCGPSSTKIATEEDYYLSEWNSEEKEKGLHLSSLKFADNSRSERGRKEDSETKPVDETPSTKV